MWPGKSYGPIAGSATVPQPAGNPKGKRTLHMGGPRHFSPPALHPPTRSRLPRQESQRGGGGTRTAKCSLPVCPPLEPASRSPANLLSSPSCCHIRVRTLKQPSQTMRVRVQCSVCLAAAALRMPPGLWRGVLTPKLGQRYNSPALPADTRAIQRERIRPGGHLVAQWLSICLWLRA